MRRGWIIACCLVVAAIWPLWSAEARVVRCRGKACVSRVSSHHTGRRHSHSLKSIPRGRRGSSSVAVRSKWSPRRLWVADRREPVVESAPVRYESDGEPKLDHLVRGQRRGDGRIVVKDAAGREVRFAYDGGLQESAEAILADNRVPYGALVALDPNSGRVLAAAGYSQREGNGSSLVTRATFPAASLFKVVTTAAGVERAGLHGAAEIRFRGGNYTLERSNYYPDAARDSRKMQLKEALGKSCNPVFARVAMNYLSPATITAYAKNFGFNAPIPFEVAAGMSHFEVDASDQYDFARTAAGFGDVHISPLHAAMVAAAVGNGGRMMRPYLIDEVRSPDGAVAYTAKPMVLRQSIRPETAAELKSMMLATTSTGTARRQFAAAGVQVAGKTGTLKGDDPEGLYHWFIGLAPAENPRIAVSALVIESGDARVKASMAARMLLDRFFGGRSMAANAVVEARAEESAAPRGRGHAHKRRKSAALGG